MAGNHPRNWRRARQKRALVTRRNKRPMNSGHPTLLKFYRSAVMRCVALVPSVPLLSDVYFIFSQIAAEQQRRSLSPVTPTRQLHTVVSTSTTSGLISEPTGPTSPFRGSNVFQSPQFDVPSQSPVEKLEAVKQYLRDRSDQPLHHVEYVGLVSLLKDSVQGLGSCTPRSQAISLTSFHHR